MTLKIRKYRNQKDFKFGSFVVRTNNDNEEILIRGILKKTHNYATYILIYDGDKHY